MTTQTLPPWFRQEVPNTEKISFLKNLLNVCQLHTVCEGARCPNLGECWGNGVATFMILGDVCTRACRFCAVQFGKPQNIDIFEPARVAEAVSRLGLHYVVITSVTRDDLEDKGAGQFVKTIHAIRTKTPQIKIEVLIPDFDGDKNLLKQLVEAKPDVIGHNLETVQRFSSALRPQASYEKSLFVLRALKELDSFCLTKSGFMVGLGENEADVENLMQDLACVGCDILTIGQYLAPSKDERHLPVERFVLPEEFESYKGKGKALGFKHVASGPLVRSSFLAEEGYETCLHPAELS